MNPQHSEALGKVDPDVAAIQRIGAVPTILKVVSEVTGLRLALVARVTQDEWTACAVLDRMSFGLAVGDHLDVATTLCSEVRDSHEPIIIEHASEDAEFCTHRTPKLYGIESYIAVPIFRPGGEYFGNVCALDSNPAPLRDGKTRAMMELFAELISLQLADDERSAQDREALFRERVNAELREQFIAVLGHDLRNPLSSIVAGSAFLLKLPQEGKQKTVLERVHRSAQRMARLVDDIMDFARGRLGGGMAIARDETDAEELARGVVEEIESAHPARQIRVRASGAGRARLDRSRAAQMLSNLVANAVEHSDAEAPIEVVVDGFADRVVFQVSSRGAPIPADTMPRLFQPFFRGIGNRPRTGLGLGLYIAGEIARAHGGSIAARSTDDGETTFSVELPRVREIARGDLR